IGIALVLVVYYGGSSIFNSGPIATGPGQGIGVPTPGLPAPLGFGVGQAPAGKPEPGVSPFQGAVLISTVRYSETDVQQEYIIIRSGGVFGFGGGENKSVSIDGWTIENNNGNRVAIPPAVNIPSLDSTPRPIQLNPGDEALIITGDSSFGASFRENICTGYLNESHSFSPALEESCPEFSKEDILGQSLNAACVDVIDRSTRCRQVIIGYEDSAAGNDCIAFVQSHLNYAGCVKDNKDAERFFTGRWRVFLKMSQKLWNSLHDRVILRDKEGLIVDEYSY
ncbi:MAG: hypothetical protein WAP51_00005, partial [Candidatus Sungiibacteriota bacterium]